MGSVFRLFCAVAANNVEMIPDLVHGGWTMGPCVAWSMQDGAADTLPEKSENAFVKACREIGVQVVSMFLPILEERGGANKCQPLGESLRPVFACLDLCFEAQAWCGPSTLELSSLVTASTCFVSSRTGVSQSQHGDAQDSKGLSAGHAGLGGMR